MRIRLWQPTKENEGVKERLGEDRDKRKENHKTKALQEKHSALHSILTANDIRGPWRRCTLMAAGQGRSGKTGTGRSILII